MGSEVVFWWWDQLYWAIRSFVQGSLDYPESGSVQPRIIAF